MRCIEYISGAVADDLAGSLGEHGAAYLQYVGEDDNLVSLAPQLGTVVEPGVGMPDRAHDGRVYRVGVRNQGEGLRDAHGNVILSSTSLEFPLHTDAYNRPTPPRYVFLLRVDDGDDDTPTYVSDSRPVIKELSEQMVFTLREPVFPSARGPVPVLEPDQQGHDRIRFNQEEIDRWEGEGASPVLQGDARDALSELGEALRRRQEPVTIRHGDCLVIDNARMCHGRPALSPDSDRELTRVWVV